MGPGCSFVFGRARSLLWLANSLRQLGSRLGLRTKRMRSVVAGCRLRSGQIWWRFLYLEQYPFTLAQLVDPLNEDPLRSAHHFWDTPRCCKTDSFCMKLHTLYGDAQRLADDEEFKWLLRNWSRQQKITNMHVERLFALIKKGVASNEGKVQRTNVERFVAAGTLTQWMTEHGQSGGQDPRFSTRAALLKRGAPLRCSAKKAKTRTRPASAFFIFRSDFLARRRAELGKVTKTIFKHEQRQLSAEWRALGPEERRRFRNKARAQHSSKMLAPLRDESNPTHRLRPALWGLNEETSPLATAVFERAVCKHLGTDQLPGSRRYCRMLRDDLASKMFVADRGDIGRASIPLRKPCWQQFPGMCVTRDATLWTDTLDLAAGNLLKAMCREEHQPGTFFLLRASRNKEIIQRFYCLAFVRKRDPCLAVFALCEQLMAGLIHFVGKDGRLAFRAHTAALRDLFLGGDVEDLRLCRPRV